MDKDIEEEINRLHDLLGTQRRAIAFTHLLLDPVKQYDVRAQKGDTGETHYNRQYATGIGRLHIDAVNKFYVGTIKGRSPQISRYLDAGCADGVRTLELINYLKDFSIAHKVALDLSPEMVSAAADNLTEFDIKEANLLEFTDTPFDLVTCMFNVIGQFPEDKIPMALANLARLTSQGGLLCIDATTFTDKDLEYLGYTQEDQSNKRQCLAYYPCAQQGGLIWREDNKPLIATARFFTEDELASYIDSMHLGIVDHKRFELHKESAYVLTQPN